MQECCASMHRGRACQVSGWQSRGQPARLRCWLKWAQRGTGATAETAAPGQRPAGRRPPSTGDAHRCQRGDNDKVVMSQLKQQQHCCQGELQTQEAAQCACEQSLYSDPDTRRPGLSARHACHIEAQHSHCSSQVFKLSSSDVGQYLAESSKHARNADQGVCLWRSNIQTQRCAHHGGNAPKSRAQRSTCIRSLSVSRFTFARGPETFNTAAGITMQL